VVEEKWVYQEVSEHAALAEASAALTVFLAGGEEL